MAKPDTPCPICGRDLAHPQSVFVCSPCHEALQASGAVSVHITGEFPAVSQLANMPEGAATPRARRATNPAEHHCTWCGRAGDTVKKLLTQGAVKICNECVALCADIMQAELGDDWR
jgi:hypothetical protein